MWFAGNSYICFIVVTIIKIGNEAEAHHPNYKTRKYSCSNRQLMCYSHTYVSMIRIYIIPIDNL